MLTARPSGSSAIPVCCSTVTPGKLATFWRSPVRRLNRVVLPELGGPTSATVRTAAGRGSSSYRGTTAAMAIAAIAHGILGFGSGLWDLTGLSARTFKRRAVSRRSAISEPSTWKTRGSPPGALSPAVMRVPGTKPSSIRRRASSVGKSMRSRMAASPFRRSTRLACGASGLAAVATQLQHGFSMRESEILVKRPDGACHVFFLSRFPRTLQVRQNKG